MDGVLSPVDAVRLEEAHLLNGWVLEPLGKRHATALVADEEQARSNSLCHFKKISILLKLYIESPRLLELIMLLITHILPFVNRINCQNL